MHAHKLDAYRCMKCMHCKLVAQPAELRKGRQVKMATGNRNVHYSCALLNVAANLTR